MDSAMDESKKLLWNGVKHGASNAQKKKRVGGEGLTNSALGIDAELRREMMCVIDWEISSRFQHIHDLANKYAFLTPSNLFDDYQLGEVDEVIEKEEFFAERKRLQYFCGRKR